MSGEIAVRTIVPLFLIIGLGFLSRRLGVMKQGDEKILNAFVYFFALPALFVVNLSETQFTADNLRFMVAGIVPIVIGVLFFAALRLVLRLSRDILYLLILSTVFGSLAFFGIPFVMFAYPGIESERYATLAVASISPVSVFFSITALELYSLETPRFLTGIGNVARRLVRNPLILSLACGAILSLAGLSIPQPVSRALHMLGGTTSTVALFLLGVFLYGRRYTNLKTAFALSLLRILFLPLVALATVWCFHLQGLERSTVLLMHAMPTAISLIVLSERYHFFQETIASLVLISSLGAALYLNLWLFIAG